MTAASLTGQFKMPENIQSHLFQALSQQHCLGCVMHSSSELVFIEDSCQTAGGHCFFINTSSLDS